MSKTLRNLLIVFLSIALLFFIGLIISNLVLKSKIENFTTNGLPENIEANYKSLSLHLLTGRMTLDSVSIALKNKSNDKKHTSITSKEMILDDFSYWDYIFNKKVHLDKVKIESPIIQYHKNKLIRRSDSTVKSESETTRKPISIKALTVENATVVLHDTSEKDTLLHTQSMNVTIGDILINQETLANKLPFHYGAYQIDTDTLFVKVSPYENLRVGKINFTNKKLLVKNLHLATKFSIAQHTRMLKKERDHFDVTLDRLEIDNFDFGFNNKRFFAKSNLVTFKKADAVIYRNKLVADDPTSKPLYSEMLRELPISLTIDSLNIKNSSITYEEKVKADRPAGTIYFNNLNAKISNLSNTYPKGKSTNITIDAQFMKGTPINVDWTFDVNNTDDDFTFKANLGRLAAKEMNSFTKPNLNVGLEGEAVKTYFSIYGNENQSNIDMRIDYENFKVEVLRDEGKKKSGLLSSIVNIFVHKDSKDNDDGAFSKGSATVTPDKTKSFFNYLWINISAALKDCLL